jgi:hypothetical protein
MRSARWAVSPSRPGTYTARSSRVCAARAETRFAGPSRVRAERAHRAATAALARRARLPWHDGCCVERVSSFSPSLIRRMRPLPSAALRALADA